jgi:hypothetical protein
LGSRQVTRSRHSGCVVCGAQRSGGCAGTHRLRACSYSTSMGCQDREDRLPSQDAATGQWPPPTGRPLAGATLPEPSAGYASGAHRGQHREHHAQATPPHHLHGAPQTGRAGIHVHVRGRGYDRVRGWHCGLGPGVGTLSTQVPHACLSAATQ